MHGPLRALLCLGSLAALSTPTAPAQAAAPQIACRMYAAKPHVTAGEIQESAARPSCGDTAPVRTRTRRAVARTDSVVKNAARGEADGRVAARARCAPDVRHRGGTDPCPPAPVPAWLLTIITGPVLTAAPCPPVQCPYLLADDTAVLDRINAERRAGGCGPLANDSRLRTAALGHSKDMADNNYFSHTSRNGRTPLDRIKASGFTPVSAWAENIAMGYPTPADVVTGWMNSAGHRANIMNCAYTHAGVGLARTSRNVPYWTMNFARH